MKKIAVLVLLLLLTACKHIETVIEKPVYIRDTVQSVKVQRDSIYTDRWHTEYVKGDTVYVTDNQVTVKYITRTDTAYKVVEKPVEVMTSQIKEVEKKLTKWQSFCLGLGRGALVVILLGVGAWCVHFVRQFLKK